MSINTIIDTNTLYSKVEYSGKDLYTKGLGGAETALINLAENLGDCTVYNFTEKEETYNGVTYIRYGFQVPLDKPAFIQRSVANIGQIPHGSILLLHDQIFDNKDLLCSHLDNGNIKKIAVLSNFQKKLLLDHIGDQYTSSVIKYRNGTKFVRSSVTKNKNKFLYAHNPWRGLENLLKMWQSIKIGIPDAELHVFSGGFFKRDVDTQNYYDWLKVEYSYLNDVYFNPLVSEQKLEKEYQTSYLYLYPGKTPETFGISVLHAIATGTPIVMNAVDGLIETAPDSVAKHARFDDDQSTAYIAHIMRLYYDDTEWTRLHEESKKIDCSWSVVASNLLKEIQKENTYAG